MSFTMFEMVDGKLNTQNAEYILKCLNISQKPVVL